MHPFVATGIAIMGIASTCNPFQPDYRSGGREIASGEPYDATAAIQTNLRERFGGVGFGKTYRPMQLGLTGITVTPLPGDSWSPGPIVCREPL
jgi:hypothetical protein